MKHLLSVPFVFCTIALLIVPSVSFAIDNSQNKPSCKVDWDKERVVILTDVENEPDDAMSLVRLMVYSNKIDIQALVATTSTHMRDRVCPKTIEKIVRAYGSVRDNLLLHEEGFPTMEYLLNCISTGVVAYGMKGVGEGQDSAGSEKIIELLNSNDERPLWVCAFGGVNTLAQALWKIDKTFPKHKAQKLYSKLRVYTISDQDDSGPWIRKTFPTIFYIVSPGYNYDLATWKGIKELEPGSDFETVSDEWLAKNIQQGHGALGAMYPDVTYSMEGDTPSFLGLIHNGLNIPERPDMGGWGGRYRLYLPEFSPSTNTIDMRPIYAARGEENVSEDLWFRKIPANTDPSKDNAEYAETRPIWTNAEDTVTSNGITTTSPFATIWRWRKDYQNDFAARMDWCVKPYSEANHNPVIILDHPAEFTAKAGEQISVFADDSYDPDGDSISFEWSRYPETDTYENSLRINPVNMHELELRAPRVDHQVTISIILKVTDKGTPALSSYQRLIITVCP